MTQTEDARKNKGFVLVVDDFQDGRELTADILSFAGFEVEQAENGETALGIVASRRPEVVLTDLSLPDIDGCEITRRLKSDGGFPEIGVVVLTAHGGEDYEGKAQEAGCDLFMVKPTPPRVLIAAIEELVEKKRRVSRRARKP